MFLERDSLCMCFDRVYCSEMECIVNNQLEDACTTKRLQQVRQCCFCHGTQPTFLFALNHTLHCISRHVLLLTVTRQHVRIALRKNSDGGDQGEADEVEINLYTPALLSCRAQCTRFTSV